MYRQTYFKNFIYSYLLTLLIPLLLIGSYSYFTSKNHVQDTFKNTNQLFNQNIQQAMEHQYKKLQNIHNRLIIDSSLRKFLIENEPLAAIKLQKILGDYTYTNDILYNIVVYFDKDDYVYNGNTSCIVDRIDDYLYPFSLLEEDYYKSPIRTVEDYTQFIEVSKTYAMLTSQFTFFNFSMNYNNGVITMIVDNQKLVPLFNKLNVYPYNIHYLIINKNNHIIATNAPEVSPSEYSHLLAQQDDSSIELGNDKYIVAKSSSSDFTYISLINKRHIDGSVFSSQKLFWYGIFFCMILSFLSIYYWMIKLYRPILHLNKYSNTLLPSEQDHSVNELDSVKNTIKFLAQSNKELNMRIDDYSISSRNNFLYQIIKGYYTTKDSLLAQAEYENIFFDYDYFTIAVIDIKKVDLLDQDKESLLTAINKQFKELPVNLYHYDHFESNKTILIICSAKDSIASLLGYFKNLQKESFVKLDIATTIGLGQSYDVPHEIIKSYMQASTAISYEFLNGINQTYMYTETNINSYSSELLPIKKLDKLKKLILLNDQEAIHNLIYHLELYLKTISLPIFTLRGICHEINHMMINIINELQKIYTAINTETTTLLLLKDYSSMKDFFLILEKVSLILSESIRNDSHSTQSTILNDIKQYLDSNALNNMFSLNVMSDHFKISPSQLCQIFKDETKMTITDYLTDIRINEAKTLLTTTDNSIKSIAAAVGYNNVSSFIRRFKQINSITPGHFRNLYTKE